MRNGIRFVRTRGAAALLAVVLVLTGASLLGGSSRHLTMYFTNTVGLYKGDSVKILGIRVGRIDSIKAEPTGVRVVMSYGAGHKLPMDVKGAIIAPSLVSGRYVELSPAYSGGPVLPDNAVITYEPAKPRTAVPVEWPEVERELTSLVTQLGPNPSNPTGTLAELVDTVAANLDHKTATQLRSTISGLSLSVGALENSKSDLFATIRNLSSFIDNLVRNNAAVTDFSQQLNAVSGTLAENSGSLQTTVTLLQQALAQLTSYVNHNRSAIGDTVTKLGALTDTLSRERVALADVLHTAPTALSNYYNMLDPRYDAITGRAALANLQNMVYLICQGGGTSTALPSTAVSECSALVASLSKALGVPAGGSSAGGLNLPLLGGGSSSALPNTSASNAGLGGTTSTLVGSVSPALGGLLGLLAPGGSK